MLKYLVSGGCALLLASCSAKTTTTPESDNREPASTAEPSSAASSLSARRMPEQNDGSRTSDVLPQHLNGAATVSKLQKGGEDKSLKLAPTFNAFVRPTKAFIDADFTVTLQVTNRGGEILFVPNPLQGGDSLHLRLTLPTGEERTINVGKQPGGVQSRLVNFRVLPHMSETIQFDLRNIVDIGGPGNYRLLLDYEWKAKEHWRSPEISFSVLAP